MKLYLVRHGIAAESGPAGLGDAGRPLTDEGIERMKAEARGMRRLGVKPDALLSSPLVRARQTADLIGKALGLETQLADELAPGCDGERLRTLLRRCADCTGVMIVGHEPDFSELLAELSGARLLMKKGSLARLDLSDDYASGTLSLLLPPRVLRAAGA